MFVLNRDRLPLRVVDEVVDHDPHRLVIGEAGIGLAGILRLHAAAVAVQHVVFGMLVEVHLHRHQRVEDVVVGRPRQVEIVAVVGREVGLQTNAARHAHPAVVAGHRRVLRTPMAQPHHQMGY